MKDYIIKKQWSDPIFVEDCDQPVECEAPVECEEVKVCRKPTNDCKKYLVAGIVDDRKKYKKYKRRCRKPCKDDGCHWCYGSHGGHGYHGGSYQKGCGDFGGKSLLAPCMPQCKVIIDANCNTKASPNGAPFRFRLPLPLAEYCDKDQGKYTYNGMIQTDVKFTAQVENEVVLEPGQALWLIVDVFDDGPCKRKLLERRAVMAPIPADGVEADPFEFELFSKKKCVDFRGHILFESYFVIGGLTPPDLRSNLIKVGGIVAPFSDYVDPVFEVVAFPTTGYTPGHGGHHGGHGGHHGHHGGWKGGCGKPYCKRC